MRIAMILGISITRSTQNTLLRNIVIIAARDTPSNKSNDLIPGN